jgi:hypothetical protein
MLPQRATTISFWTCLLLVLTILCPPPGAAPPAAAQDDAWIPVTILYHSDVKGHIEPCG